MVVRGNFRIAAAFGLWILNSGLASAASAPAGIKFELASFDGSGCTAKDAVKIDSVKGNSLTISVPKLSVEWKGQQSQSNIKSFCQIQLKPKFDGKWRYAIDKVSLKVRGIFGPESHGQLVAAYTHKSNNKTAGKTSYLEGAALNAKQDVGVELTKEWSDCANHDGTNLVVGGGFVKDQNPTAVGLSTVEVSGPISVNFVWEKCN